MSNVIERPAPGGDYPPEMHEYVMQYVDAVMAEVKPDDILLVEQRLPIGHITGEEGASGTGDAIVIKPVEAQIHDLKYGMGVQVYASERVDGKQFQDSEAGRAFLVLVADSEDEAGTVEVPNPQCGLYGLGVIHEYEIAYDFQIVRMFIHQPRLDHISSFAISVEALKAWGEWVKTKAAQVRCAENFDDGPIEEFYGSYFNPGEKQCRWCRAKATCVPLSNFVAKAIANDFDDHAAPPKLEEVAKVESPAPEFLGVAMAKVDLVEDWCRAVRAEVESNLLVGRPVDGWKLVEGRQGARQWNVKGDEDLEKLRKRYKIPTKEFYEKSAISPTSAEKLFKTRPVMWEKLQAVITRTKGKPSVAPMSDKRPAIQTATTADDFVTHED